jgi:hypothetical protein
VPRAFANETHCYRENELKCLLDQRERYSSMKKIQNACGSLCPSECSFQEFSKSASLSNYPTFYYLQVLIDQKAVTEKLAKLFKTMDAPGHQIGCYPYKTNNANKQEQPQSPKPPPQSSKAAPPQPGPKPQPRLLEPARSSQPPSSPLPTAPPLFRQIFLVLVVLQT